MKTWEKRIKKCQKKHRPKLKNWQKDDFYNIKNEKNTRFLSRLQSDSGIVDVESPRRRQYSVGVVEETVDRIDCVNLKYENFIECYEKPYVPLIIRNIPDNESWKALQNWKIEWKTKNNKNKIAKSSILHTLKQRMFKVGEDDDGYKVKCKMKYFTEYLGNNTDDSPLYIFDSNYDNDAVSKCLLEDYRVPSYFPEDLFSLVGEKRRPPYRWWLVGPKRSGTCLHIDPLGTSAWNTVLHGRKRWVLFPPGVSKSVAKGIDCIIKGEDDEAINYFVDILPRIRAKYGLGTASNIPIIEFTQYPGDTVFVPGGWWHAVLNLDDTIAITQNYCSSANFEAVWKKTRSGRKKMAVKWLKKLHATNPRLAAIAERLNSDDGFHMYDKKANKASE